MSHNIAICIGAQKAGTTWLFRCLQEHPDIAAAPSKEIHFFSREYDPDKINEYLKSFEGKDDNQVLLDVSPTYLSCEKCPERIHTHFPNAKIIAILRDPAERSFSQYLHYISTKRIKNESLEEAVKIYPEILEYSSYKKYLAIYRKYFSEKQLLTIDYEKLENDPQGVIDSVCDFLSVQRFTPSILTKHYHSTQARSNYFYHKLVKVYLKLNKSTLGKWLLSGLRKIGINALLFDKIMCFTAPAKPKLNQEKRLFLEKQIDAVDRTTIEG